MSAHLPHSADLTTGQIEFILWRERADAVSFKEGDVIRLDNAVVSRFSGVLNLTTAFETSITVLEEEMAAVTKSAKRLQPSSNVVSMDTSILAVKEWVVTYSCMSCRKPINVDDNNNALIMCNVCSCMFLKDTVPASQKCMVLLSCNNQWFTA